MDKEVSVEQKRLRPSSQWDMISVGCRMIRSVCFFALKWICSISSFFIYIFNSLGANEIHETILLYFSLPGGIWSFKLA